MVDVAVLAPSAWLTITVERAAGSGDDEIHLHPGGQGFWVARLLHELGQDVSLCCPAGGESGTAMRALLPTWGVADRTVVTETATACYVHDRRGGERCSVADVAPAALDRHGLDNLYSGLLAAALEASICVVTGRPGPQVAPVDLYERLGRDLAELAINTVGDLHGEELDAFLAGGRLEVLKVSDEDLMADTGSADLPDEDALWDQMAKLADRGVGLVVVSRADRGTLAYAGGRRFAVRGPRLTVVEHRGAGDSMTAGLAVAARRPSEPAELLALASAAAAANVVRRGLGTANADLIATLLPRIEVDELG